MTHVANVEVDEWQATIDGDLHSFFHVMKATLPQLRADSGGSFVAITSAGIDRHRPLDILLVAVKAGIEALMRGIAREEGRFGIQAISVAPSVMKRNIAVRRLGTIEKVVKVAAFLASADASYVTASILQWTAASQYERCDCAAGRSHLDRSTPALASTVLGLAAHQVRRQALTFAEFDSKTDHLASGLLALGLGRGDRVAWWLNNSIEWALTLCAHRRRRGADQHPLHPSGEGIHFGTVGRQSWPAGSRQRLPSDAGADYSWRRDGAAGATFVDGDAGLEAAHRRSGRGAARICCLREADFTSNRRSPTFRSMRPSGWRKRSLFATHRARPATQRSHAQSRGDQASHRRTRVWPATGRTGSGTHPPVPRCRAVYMVLVSAFTLGACSVVMV
jgi:Enoyl-(Acyl carrier protein) reductase/AMP-binding enzyme